MKPKPAQTEKLYDIAYWITKYLKEPITIIRVDERTPHYLYVQFGTEDERFFLITVDGEILSDESN